MDILTDKRYKDYDYLSRYTKFPYYYNTEDKKYIYGTTLQLDDQSGYILHIVKKGDTIDGLAFAYYNNPTLYWVICDFNHIQDPFIELEIDTQIRIPILSNIKFK